MLLHLGPTFETSSLARRGPHDIACSTARGRASGDRRPHMLMQDKNNAEIAEVIQRWLAGKGLVE
jgi:hypothetical protein